MTKRRALAVALAAASMVAVAMPATSSAANPWTTPANQFLNMAHQGGELEAPGNTLYAFKTALKDRGADAVEMDAYITSDGELVVSHDRTVNDTTDYGQPSAEPPWNGSPSSQIWDHTLAELKLLDAAYKFSPGKGEYSYNPSDPHPFRGIATGDVAPPAGYTANDFKIPTFQEVLDELPAGTKINIDIKDQTAYDPGHAHGIAAAQELAAILAAQPGGDNENVMVASFGEEQIEAFHAAMPQHDSISGSLDATNDYALGGQPFNPEIQAMQPPDKYELSPGVFIDTPEFLKQVMTNNGDDYAIHVWAADGTDENDALYSRLVSAGMQGFFPQNSTELATYLCANHVPDATGTPRCTPPAQPVGPIGSLGKVSSKKGKIKAGKKAKVNGSVTNGGDQPMTNVRACVEIPKKAKKALKAKCVNVGEVAPGATAEFTITVKSSKKKAKGKYKLGVEVTSDNGGMQTGTVTLSYKAKQGKTGSAK